MDKYVVVIGAANADIGGSPYNELIESDSNPGHINISFGGVGRNIAENLSKLGVSVKLIAAVGNDIFGNSIINNCENCGIDISHILIENDFNSSMYLFINNKEGDMALALSDVDIANQITPEYIDSVKDVLNKASCVVMDCNISHDTIKHVMEICEVPVFVDPVSVTHASKIKNQLYGINTIKPNKLEVEYLTGIKIEKEEDYIKAANILFESGIKRVYISMGSKGVFTAEEGKYYIVEKYPAEVKSTTGAGDSAAAAIVWSILNSNEVNLVESAKAANAAASMTVSSLKTINPELSENKIITIINEDKMKVRKL